jgi:hypothetical protein
MTDSKDKRLRRLQDLLAPEGERPTFHGWWCPSTCDHSGMATFRLDVFVPLANLMPPDATDDDA